VNTKIKNRGPDDGTSRQENLRPERGRAARPGHLIQQGKALPEKYRFILFEDKREVELVWNGKTRDVCTTVLPFQTLEHIDEPRAKKPRRRATCSTAVAGRQRGWTNKLIWGDNKLILSSLKAGRYASRSRMRAA
jgi:hypothetical protein